MEPIKTTPNQLLAEIGNLSFTAERMIEMLAEADDKNEDFLLQHRHNRFIVPAEEIHKFFSTRPKPARPMTKDQELEYLRKKMRDYEAMLDANRIAQKPGVVPPEREVSPGHFEPPPPLKPETEETFAEEDPLIPPTTPGKVETPDEVRARLKSELAGKQPIRPRGRPAKLPTPTGKAAEISAKG